MTALSNVRYRLLPDEVELAELNPNRTQEFIPDIMYKIFRMSGVNYGLIDRKWHNEYEKDQSLKVGRQISQIYPFRVLFPKIMEKEVLQRKDLKALNDQITKLYSLIYTGPRTEEIIEGIFLGANKVFCYKRFKKHSEQLTEFILDEKSIGKLHPERYICQSGFFSLVFLVLNFSVIYPRTDHPEFAALCAISGLFAIWCLQQTIQSCTYKTNETKAEAFFGRPLEEVRAQLRPGLIEVVVIP